MLRVVIVFFFTWLLVVGAKCQTKCDDPSEYQAELSMFYHYFKKILNTNEIYPSLRVRLSDPNDTKSSPLTESTMNEIFDTIIANARLYPNYDSTGILFKSSFPPALNRYKYEHNFNIKLLNYSLSNETGEELCVKGGHISSGSHHYSSKTEMSKKDIEVHSNLYQGDSLITNSNFTGELTYEISYITEYVRCGTLSDEYGSKMDNISFEIIENKDGHIIIDQMGADTITNLFTGAIYRFHADTTLSYSLEPDLPAISSRNKGGLSNGKSTSYSFSTKSIPERMYTDPNYTEEEFKVDYINKSSNKYFVINHGLPSTIIDVYRPIYYTRTFTMQVPK